MRHYKTELIESVQRVTDERGDSLLAVAQQTGLKWSTLYCAMTRPNAGIDLSTAIALLRYVARDDPMAAVMITANWADSHLFLKKALPKKHKSRFRGSNARKNYRFRKEWGAKQAAPSGDTATAKKNPTP